MTPAASFFPLPDTTIRVAEGDKKGGQKREHLGTTFQAFRHCKMALPWIYSIIRDEEAAGSNPASPTIFYLTPSVNAP